MLRTDNRGDRDALRRCAIEFCEDQASQGVLYTEVRFAPQLMSGKIPGATEDTDSPALTSDDVTQLLLDAFAEGSKPFGIKVRSILTLSRPNPGMDTVLSYSIINLCYINVDIYRLQHLQLHSLAHEMCIINLFIILHYK